MSRWQGHYTRLSSPVAGTNAHAVINLNRQDDGKRKYLLIEMGHHFDTVLKPRVMKAVYAEKWKDAKPRLP